MENAMEEETRQKAQGTELQPSDDDNWKIGAGVFIGVVAFGVLILLLNDPLSFLGGLETIGLSTVIRNYGLLVSAVVAIALGTWRSIIASKQADTSNKQYALAERGHNADRFQKGAEMLGHSAMAVRIAGLSTIKQVAQIDQTVFGEIAIDTITSFIKDRSIQDHVNFTEKIEDLRLLQRGKIYVHRPPEDIFEGIKLLNFFSEIFPNKGIVLSGCNFEYYTFEYVNFRHFFLSETKFTNVIFANIDCSYAVFSRAEFRRGKLYNCDFRDAIFTAAKLRECNIFGGNFDGAVLDLVQADAAQFNEIENAEEGQFQMLFFEPGYPPEISLKDGTTTDWNIEPYTEDG